MTNKRIQKKQHKQYLLNLAKQAGIDVVTQREIKRKQMLDTKAMNQDFDQWLNDHKPEM